MTATTHLADARGVQLSQYEMRRERRRLCLPRGAHRDSGTRTDPRNESAGDEPWAICADCTAAYPVRLPAVRG